MSEKPPVQYLPVSFADLPGWRDADPRAALHAFRTSCEVPGPIGTAFPIASETRRNVCHAARTERPTDTEPARAFFETHFTPHRVVGRDGATGLFTGYYEPLLKASRRKRAGYAVPIYGLPPGAKEGAVLPARAEIENRPAKDWPVLFWAADLVDVFTLQVQGSGRLALAEGGFARVSYAGDNGRGYIAIGRVMRERNLLPEGGADMPAIRAWLKANPDAARALMQENPRYIFFRANPHGAPPKGQSGVALTSMASLAIDPAFIPYGMPLWLDTNWPKHPEKKLRLLVVAQDTGAAIKGAVRGDIFWGSGDAALEHAGRMAERGEYYLLLPRSK